MKTLYILGSAMAALCFSAAGTGSGAAGGQKQAQEAEKKTADHAASLKPVDDRDREIAELKKKLAEAEGNASTAAKSSAFEADILRAVSKLKHTSDADWQEDGRPSLKRIIALAGNDKITAEDVDAVAGDVRRETVEAKANKTSKAALLKDADDADEREYLDGIWVRAVEVGQHGGKLREPGEEFVFTGEKPSWVVVLKSKDRRAAQDRRSRQAYEQDGNNDEDED